MANTDDLFSSILDESPTEVVRPKPLPVGTYKFRVGNYEKVVAKTGTPGLKFEFTPVDYAEDVDLDALEEAGGLEGKSLLNSFWITEASAYRLDEFHQACGIDLAKANKRSLRNDAVFNAEVLGVIKHTINGDQTYANIDRFLPV